MITEHCIVLAYIDPGTGALLLQTLIAGVIGVVYYFRAVFKKFWGWLFHRGQQHTDDESDSSKHEGGAE